MTKSAADREIKKHTLPHLIYIAPWTYFVNSMPKLVLDNANQCNVQQLFSKMCAINEKGKP